eukprot:Protomagalhaensia_wolfi_Nauph_80__340@NODE_118_length_3584_cov_102_178561_g91_i0_p5_GENE_NODE_118_length_3584_cov_102_178561_g91_i0NODE_118_length_3584_cov_102_178561_g91_i0_p5_ORF_typecomplete_len101_score1_65Tospo_nucleocap/PF01533_16/0_15_NODE_118_length_3584_cov_102_178561_g91_i017882090
MQLLQLNLRREKLLRVRRLSHHPKESERMTLLQPPSQPKATRRLKPSVYINTKHHFSVQQLSVVLIVGGPMPITASIAELVVVDKTDKQAARQPREVPVL